MLSAFEVKKFAKNKMVKSDCPQSVSMPIKIVRELQTNYAFNNIITRTDCWSAPPKNRQLELCDASRWVREARKKKTAGGDAALLEENKRLKTTQIES
ncbi:MAG: hypothetical protein IT342_04290 [Candidatus Melainabacteria bacterium]|nr:hypothetical protein [Candidatus Melainabacteria bacterium]